MKVQLFKIGYVLDVSRLHCLENSMVDLDTQMKIEKLIRECYDRTFDIIKKTENTPDESHVLRTLIVENDNPADYMKSFVQHYQGVFEGMFTALFDNDFNKYPNPEEILFIQDTMTKDWEKLIDIATKYARLEYEKMKNRDTT